LNSEEGLDANVRELLALAKTKVLPMRTKNLILVSLRERREQSSAMKSLVEQEDGILPLLKQWLQGISTKEDITDEERELVKNILCVLEILPITLQSLRSSSIGKVVNKLKSSHLSNGSKLILISVFFTYFIYYHFPNHNRY